MTHLAEVLRTLAGLDGAIDDLARQIRQKPLELQKDQLKVDDAKVELDSSTAALKALDVETRSHEKNHQAKQDELQKTKVQQNQAKSNEEYQAHQRKIDSLEEDISNLETAILEAYEKREELEQSISARKRTLAQAEAVLNESKQRIAGESTTLSASITKLQEQRDTARKQLEGDDRAVYDRTYEKQRAKTVVGVLGRICQGCFVSLRPNDLAILESGDTLVRCTHCARLLFLEE